MLRLVHGSALDPVVAFRNPLPTGETLSSKHSKYLWPIGIFVASRAVVGVALFALTLVSKYESPVYILSRWDGVWYLRIASVGYPRLESGLATPMAETVAFFPGYPVAIGAVTTVVPVSLPVAGIFVATVAAAVAAVLLWKLGVRLADESTANRAVALFCFFPSAFILSMVYSDALFIAVALGCLLALLDKRWILAGILAGTGTLVRPTGVVLIACCAWAAMVDLRRSRSWKPVMAPLLAPAGLLAYLGYLYAHTGSALAFYEVEDKIFDQRFDFGVSNVRHFFELLGGGGSGSASTFQLLMLVLAIPTVLLVALLLFRAPPPGVLLIYIVGIFALALLGSNTTSVPRFLLAACPVLVPVSAALSERVYSIVLASMAAIMISLFFVVSATLVLPA